MINNAYKKSESDLPFETTDHKLLSIIACQIIKSWNKSVHFWIRIFMSFYSLIKVLWQTIQIGKKRKRRTTDSQHLYPRYPNLVKALEITYPDQVWVSDITYIRLLEDFV